MCQGLLPSRRHIEKREDPGDEVATVHSSFKQGKDVSKRDVIDIFTCERYIFYSVKTIFLSERNPCNSLIYIITWIIICH